MQKLGHRINQTLGALLAFSLVSSTNIPAARALDALPAQAVAHSSDFDNLAGPRQDSVVLAIHGFALNKDSFSSLSSTLGAEGVEFEAIDVRGFGSRANAELDFPRAIEEIAAEIRKLRQQDPDRKVILAGESMGGALALSVAALEPKLVDGVIASEPAYRVTVNPLVYPVVFFKLLISPNAKIGIPLSFANRLEHEDALIAKVKAELKEQRGYSAKELWRFRSLMKGVPGAVKQLDNIPVLFLQGDADRLVRPSGTVKLSRLGDRLHHRLVLLHDRGHLLLEEGQADASVVSTLNNWISSLPSRQVGLAKATARETRVASSRK